VFIPADGVQDPDENFIPDLPGGSGVTRRKKAGWDDSYPPQVLQGIPAFVVR
jgi:hypothetical protein